MGLFSFLRKNKQESTVGKSDFYSQADVEQPAGRNKRKQSNKREEAVDPVLPEKKRARRRLVGAIALVLAAIIGLPMILDSEPQALKDDIDIQIPSRDDAAPLAQSKARAAADATTPPPLADSINTEEEIIELPVKKSETTTETKLVEADRITPKPAVQTELPEPKTTIVPPAIAKADQSDEAARARAILEGKAPAAAPAKASSKLVLQVAALATQEKVDELQKKLRDAGLKPYTQKVATASGERIRVRLGPFANAEEAEKVRAKLLKIGLDAKLMPA